MMTLCVPLRPLSERFSAFAPHPSPTSSTKSSIVQETKIVDDALS
jgi:hypothetical protein